MSMVRSHLVAFGFLLVWSAGCGPALSSSSAVAARGLPPAATRSPAPAPAPRWQLGYERRCTGSITAPVLSPDEQTIFFCGDRIRAEDGRYEGDVRIGIYAQLESGQVIADDYGAGGITLDTPTGSDAPRQAPGGRPWRCSVAVDETKVACIERVGARYELVVRALPSLERDEAVVASFDRAPRSLTFLRDGRLLVVPEPAWIDGARIARELLVADADGVRPLGPRWDRVEAIAGARDRDVVAVVLTDGAVELREMPDGRTLARYELPLGSDESPTDHAVAIDARGDHVAVSGEGTFVFRYDDGELAEELHVPREGTHLQLSSDGTALYVGDAVGYGVFRLTAPRSPTPPPRYAVDLPPDFLEARLEGGAPIWPGESEPEAWSQGHGIIAWLRHPGARANVTVFASDRSEMDPDDAPARWAGRVIERYWGSSVDDSVIAWRAEDGARAFQTEMTVGGCEPAYRYVRVAESGAYLYRVIVEVPPDHDRDQVETWMAALFDQPLGAPPPALLPKLATLDRRASTSAGCG